LDHSLIFVCDRNTDTLLMIWMDAAAAAVDAAASASAAAAAAAAADDDDDDDIDVLIHLQSTEQSSLDQYATVCQRS